MKVIDLLNKIAKGEELPEKIKFGSEIWKKENGGKNNVYYTNDSYHDLLVVVFQRNNTYSINDEVEIIEENEFEDIKPLVLKTFQRTGQAVTMDRLADYYFDNFKLIEDALAKVVLNQKKIISKLENNQ